MRSLSLIILLLGISTLHFGQSPHGSELKEDCSFCHQPVSWEVIPEQIKFDHKQTKFELKGEHRFINCILCHQPIYSSNKEKILKLDFREAKAECFSCHKDIHMNTLGSNCDRCHTFDTWLVKDITGLHQTSRFPLTGAHRSADCIECHKSFNNLIFEVLSIDCYSCHSDNYINTSSPDHLASGFTVECEKCHNSADFNWGSGDFNHNFFPLTGGHKTENCSSCHKTASFNGLSTECISCHRNDYEMVKDPDHVSGIFSPDCSQCHNIDAFIPALFNHSLTNFPLTGAHNSTSCASCHAIQYSGTTTICANCHQQDYNQSVNPGHTAIQLPTDCQSCHTTNPDWQPASFSIHNQYYELQGAHAAIQSDCVTCHNGNYTTTPSSCYGCHKQEYDATNNPSHTAAQFPVQCENCHSQITWSPASFNHDGSYFPIYSGKHNQQWTNCSDCHTISNNFAAFSCINCHEHNKTETDNAHTGINGYSYESGLCFACHPKGDKEGSLDHSLTAFPLTGSHTSVDCIKCHSNGYSNTPTDCISCHQQNYNSSVNPSHTALQLPSDCQSCHTTNPDWQPASFAIHGQYYQLLGAHAAIQNDCITCHNGNYTSTPNTCNGCHLQDYNSTTNPSHIAAGFPVQCEDCHSQTAWAPSSFNHDAQYFPIYSGAHREAWTKCSDCHTNQSNFSIFSCTDCHEHNKTEMDEKHREIPNYVYNSSNCLGCHPAGKENKALKNNRY